MNIPQKLKNISPYDPTESMYNVKLDANESFFNLSKGLREKISNKVLNVEYNRYPDPSVKITNALAAKHFNVLKEEIVSGNGSDELISVVLNAFCPKGSSIMVLEPDFSMYEFYSEIFEIKPVSLKKEDGFNITADLIIDNAKKLKPEGIIFSNPCNPAGGGIEKVDVIRIIENLPETLVIVDEAYMEFWNQSIIDNVTQYDNALVLKTMSKAFGLASIRLGFAIGNEKIISEINKVRSPFNINSLTQAVAEVVLEDTSWAIEKFDKIKNNKNDFENMLKKLLEGYSGIELQSTKTNFIIVKTNQCDIIYKKLLEQSICVRNFPKYGFLRITVGNADENKQFVNALERILKEGF